MQYTSYRYLWATRPELATPPHMLSRRVGWIGQIKMNGTCSVVAVSPERELRPMTRHGPDKPHKRWKPTAAHREAFADHLAEPGWYVFVAELMHGRVNAPHLSERPFYVHDILVYAGNYLVGETYDTRLGLLDTLFRRAGQAETLDHFRVTDHLWLAKSHRTNDLQALYDKVDRARSAHPEYEGLVVKNGKAGLHYCNQPHANDGWMAKCRFPDDAGGEQLFHSF